MSFFAQCPDIEAERGVFQNGAIRQAHGPEQSRRTDLRSNIKQGQVFMHRFETPTSVHL